MLKVFNDLSTLTEWQSPRERFDGQPARFASEIMEMLDITDAREFEEAFQRASGTLRSLGIPVEANFTKVFRFNGEDLVTDWKVSPLAGYLIIINASPSHERVAKAQLFFIMTRK